MSDTLCPRCSTPGPAEDHRGFENGALVWTILRCPTCCFTWRDSEPASAVGVGVRSKDFAVDAANLDRYPKILQQ